jgi:hypothetical protein
MAFIDPSITFDNVAKYDSSHSSALTHIGSEISEEYVNICKERIEITKKSLDNI